MAPLFVIGAKHRDVDIFTEVNNLPSFIVG